MFDLEVSPGAGESVPNAEVIQAQLAEVGLNVNVVVLDFAELIDRVYVSKPADILGAAIGFEATGGTPVHRLRYLGR